MSSSQRPLGQAIDSPMTRVALGIGLVVMALVLLVQALLMLAVDGVTDDYVRRFMRGTVDMLVKELAPLDAAARQQRVKVLDELFAYPVAVSYTHLTLPTKRIV